jgi:hypothetical protein
LEVTPDEASLAICEFPGPKVVLRKKAPNRETRVFRLTACHVYSSSLLKFGERRLDLALDLDAIDHEAVELSDRKDGIHRGIGIPKRKSPLVGLNKLFRQALSRVMGRTKTPGPLIAADPVL